VLGRFTNESIKLMTSSALKTDPWVRFFWCLANNVSLLGGHDIPPWRRCTAHKIDNFLFVHYDIEQHQFEKSFSSLPMYHLTMASHSIVTCGGIRLLNQAIEWLYWKGYEHPTVFSWSDEPVLNSYKFLKDMKPMISPFYWSILTLEILTMGPTEELFFRCAKRLNRLLPSIAGSFLVKPKALEEFLLRTTIVDIVETLFVKYHQSTYANKIFSWLEDKKKSDDKAFTNCVYMQVIHCAKILSAFYEKHSVNPSTFSPETDAILDDDDETSHKAVKVLFRRFFDGWGKKSVIDEDGRLHSWWPLVARLASLHRLELQMGSNFYAHFSFSLGTLTFSDSSALHFCHVCMDRLENAGDREVYNCGHSICLKCSLDISAANDRSTEFLAKKINTIVCPVCNKVTLSRSREYIMSVTSIDDERLEAINKMLFEGITEFTPIPPESLSQPSCLTLATSTATWNGKHVLVTYFPLTLEERDSAAWRQNPHLIRWRMAVGAFSIFNHPNISPLLGAWGPKDPSALLSFEGELYVVIKAHSFTLQKVISGRYCSWDDCLLLLRDIASGMAMFHKIKWVYKNFEASNISVIRDSKGKMTKAILSHVGSACPESEADKTEATYKYPFVPTESPKYTTASDVFNFGQLFMQVCISALCTAKAMDEWKRGKGLEQLPSYLPDRLRHLVGACVDPEPSNRPSAGHVFIQLSHECADNDRQARFARPLRGVLKWLSQNEDMTSPDDDEFVKLLRQQLKTSDLLKGAVTEFVNFIKSTHKEQLKLFIKTSPDSEKTESTSALAYSASQDIRRFTALVADTVAEKKHQKEKVAFSTREILEDVVFQSCAEWFESIYYKAYLEQDEKITKKYGNQNIVDTVNSLVATHNAAIALFNNTIRLLKDISAFPSPLQKLHNLFAAFKDIENVLMKTNNDLSTDIKWPCILYVVFKAKLPHLYSIAMMLSNFFQSYQFESEAMERATLHVAEFSSVAIYILKDLS
jgi:hypothetical protein